MPIIFVKPTVESHKKKFLEGVQRNQETGCLEWIKGLSSMGYGQFCWGGVDGGPVTTTAHRAAWMLFKGPIPDGLHILHKCNNRRCTETDVPGHLYLGTPKQNMRDCVESGRKPSSYVHYDWQNDRSLADFILATLDRDLTIEQTCVELNIGRTTFYRVKDRYPEIRAKIDASRTWHRQRGARMGVKAKLNPEMLEKCKREIIAGGIMDDICARVGITRTTMRKWSRSHPELQTLINERRV